jgi:hypothetical protein
MCCALRRPHLSERDERCGIFVASSRSASTTRQAQCAGPEVANVRRNEAKRIRMMKSIVFTTVGLLIAATATFAADRRPVIVTASNGINNQLLVFDTAGALIESVPTLGQGGAGANAGGIATNSEFIAVVNFGSQTVSLFSRADTGFELRQVVPVGSQPVSVAFGKDHLYVLGTTTVESHRIGDGGVDDAADGIVALLAADGSAAQVGVVGDQLLLTEKSGNIERVRLRGGAVVETPVTVTLPADANDRPFGFATRGTNAYVTIANSDTIAVVNNGIVTDLAATGTPGGSGQHSPCWAALVGPYLFTTNSPSHSISRLIAAGRHIALDAPVAAQTGGAPIDVAADGDLLAVVESNGGGVSHLTQYRIDEDGNLTQTISTAIASSANGVAIVFEK